MGGCRLDGLVNVIGEGGPRREGLKIGPRIRPWSRFGSTMGTKGTEFCVSMVREREIALYKSKEASDVANFELRPRLSPTSKNRRPCA